MNTVQSSGTTVRKKDTLSEASIRYVIVDHDLDSIL